MLTPLFNKKIQQKWKKNGKKYNLAIRNQTIPLSFQSLRMKFLMTKKNLITDRELIEQMHNLMKLHINFKLVT